MVHPARRRRRRRGECATPHAGPGRRPGPAHQASGRQRQRPRLTVAGADAQPRLSAAATVPLACWPSGQQMQATAEASTEVVQAPCLCAVAPSPFQCHSPPHRTKLVSSSVLHDSTCVGNDWTTTGYASAPTRRVPVNSVAKPVRTVNSCKPGSRVGVPVRPSGANDKSTSSGRAEASSAFSRSAKAGTAEHLSSSCSSAIAPKHDG